MGAVPVSAGDLFHNPFYGIVGEVRHAASSSRSESPFVSGLSVLFISNSHRVDFSYTIQIDFFRTIPYTEKIYFVCSNT